MTVRLILDTSAVLAYSLGDVNVGEPLALVANDKDEFGVPYVCLVDAGRQVDAQALANVQILTNLQHCVVLTPNSGLWRDAVGLARLLGRIDLAAAYLAASDHNANVLTAEPDRFGEPRPAFVIPI